jgi:hypothetical protein
MMLGVHGVQAGSINVRVPSVEAQAGGTVEVPIQATGAPGIGAMQLDLVYDPAVLTPDTVTRGPVLGSNGLLEFNKDKAGRLMLAMVTLDGMQGDGTIATARFKVVGESGKKSALTLENCRAWEGASHRDVLVNAQGGQVTVVGGNNYLLWIIIAAIIVLLLILFLILRKRSARKKTA